MLLLCRIFHMSVKSVPRYKYRGINEKPLILQSMVLIPWYSKVEKPWYSFAVESLKISDSSISDWLPSIILHIFLKDLKDFVIRWFLQRCSQLSDVACHRGSLLPDLTPDLCHWTAFSLWKTPQWRQPDPGKLILACPCSFSTEISNSCAAQGKTNLITFKVSIM